MPTKSLQLDGPNLEDVLKEAMTEAGPSGRVSSADRVRRGGIAGFFAREHFEVTVEFEEDREPEQPASPFTSRDDPDPDPSESSTNWLELADDTEDVVELTSIQPPCANLTLPTIGSARGVPSTERPSFAAVLAAIARDTPFDAGTPLVGDASGSSASSMESLPESKLVSAATLGPDTGRWIEAVPAHAPVSAASEDLGEAMMAPPVTSFVGLGLAGLGLPEALHPDPALLGCLEALSCPEDVRALVQLALSKSLQRLPEPPSVPQRAGGLFVVVGDLDHALEISTDLMEKAGLDKGQVLVASEARHRRGAASRTLVTTPQDAREVMSRHRRADHVTVVALHAPVSADPDAWSRLMLNAFEPTAVWGVCSATHKYEDLAAWADKLGGLDALAVVDIASTVSPAQILAAGVPVATLDGRRATPALWAAVLASRLLLEQIEFRTVAAGGR